MSSSNDLTKSVPAETTVHVSHRAELRDKAEAALVASGKGPLFQAAVGNATPRYNSAGVTVYQPADSATAELWAIWSLSPTAGGGALIAEVGHAVSESDGNDVQWSGPIWIEDTQGNLVESAFTPSVAVLAGQMHLVVVKPDGRGTLAHYIYIYKLAAWEYNSRWVVQPQTTASPSITTSTTSDILYLAFIFGGAVSLCTYTPSTTPGTHYGPWVSQADSGVPSVNAPALFTSPQRTGPELHLAAVEPDTLTVKEYVMGGSLAEWTLTPMQPGGTTNGGVGAWGTPTRAFLTAATANAENPAPQYATWLELRRWYPWRTLPGLAVYSDVTCAEFNGRLRCFYIGLQGSFYGPQVVSV